MKRVYIESYISDFRRFISPFLKDAVSLGVIAYPAKDGCLMLFEFNKGNDSSTDIRSESENIQEAMRRSNLFDKPQKASSIQGTKMVITPTLLVVLKGVSESNWSSSSAKSDVVKFVNALENKS